MVYQCEKALSDMGDKMPDDEKAPIRDQIGKLKEALKGTDTAAIKAESDTLTKMFYELSEKLYKQSAPQGDPNAGFQGGDPGASAGGQQEGGQQYYDADYKVVDDDDQNKK